MLYIQYVGVDNSADSRTYSFHVINPPQAAREFTIQVAAEEFGADRLKFQDGPGISYARLQRVLEEETASSRADAHLRIDDRDVQAYRARHYPPAKLRKAAVASPSTTMGSSPPDHRLGTFPTC